MAKLPSAFRLALKISGIAAAVVVILLVFVSVLILSPPVQRYTKTIAETEISKTLTGVITIGRIRSNVISRIDLYDVVMKDPTGSTDSLVVGHVRCKYRLLSIFDKKLDIRFIRLDNVTFSGIRDSLGKVRLPFLPRPPTIKKKSSWTVELHTVRLRKVSAFWIDSSLAINAGLKEMNFSLAFHHRLDSFDFSLSTGEGWAHTPWWDGPIISIVSKGTLSQRSLLLKSALIKASPTTISGKGIIPFTRDLPWDLAAEVESDMRQIKVLRSVKAIGDDGQVQARARWIGPIANPRLTVDATGRGLTIRGIGLDRVLVSGAYDGIKKMSGSTDVTTAMGRAKITADLDLPRLMTKPVVGGYHARCDIDGLKVSAFAKQFGLHQAIPLSTAAIHAKMQGRKVAALPDSLEATVSLLLSDNPDTGAFINARASLIYREWDLKTSSGAGNSIQAHGKITQAGDIPGLFNFSIVNPAAISRFFIPDRLTGTLRGEGTLLGTVKDPQVQAAITGSAVVWKNIVADTISAKVSYVDKNFSFADAAAQVHGSLDAILPGFHLPAARGTATLVAEGAGSIADPSLTVHMEITDPGFKTYNVKKIDADASYSHQTVTLGKLTVERDSALLSAKGLFTIKNPLVSGNLDLDLARKGHSPVSFAASGSLSKDTITAQLATDRCSIDALAPWLVKPLPVSGVFSLNAQVNGARKNPEASLEFGFDQVLKNKLLARYQGKAILRDSTAKASIEALVTGSTRGVSVEATVPFSFRKPFSIRTNVRDGASASVRAEKVNISPFVDLIDSSITANGAFSASMDLEKSAGAWLVHGNGSLSAAKFSDTGRKLWLDTLSMRAVASGTLESPAVTIDFANAAASWKSLTLRNSAGRLVLRNDTLRIDTLRGKVQKGYLGISVVIPLHGAPDSLLIKKGLLVRYAFDEIPIAPFSQVFNGPAIKSGTISGTGRLSSNASSSGPDFNGSLRLNDARIQLMDCDEPFGPVSAELQLLGDSLIIKSLRGKSKTTGKLRGSGFLSFGKDKHTAMTISTSDLRMHCVDVDAGIEQAVIYLADSSGILVLNTDVRLAESRYATYFSVASFLEQMDRPRAVAQSSAGVLDKVKLKAKVRLQQNLTIETNLGQFRLDGTVTIVGTAKKPGILGSVSVLEGYVYYLDRKFTIQSGTLRLTNTDRINPLIALTAESDQTSYNTINGLPTSYQITLKVQGDMQKPEIVLTAVPFLRQEQIVSLLTLGTIQGNVGSDATARVLSLVKQQLAGFGNRKLERLLGVESINIEPVVRPDSSGTPSSTDNGVLSTVKNQDAVVTAVKRITPRLTVQYQTDLKDLGKPNAVVSYRLLPFLYIDGTGNNVGNVGLDLRVRFTR